MNHGGNGDVGKSSSPMDPKGVMCFVKRNPLAWVNFFLLLLSTSGGHDGYFTDISGPVDLDPNDML